MSKLIIFMCCAIIATCNGYSQEEKSSSKYRAYGGELTTPKNAEISLDSSLVFAQFDFQKTAALKRYLSGNSRWEIRKEKKYKVIDGRSVPIGTVEYAIRKELIDGTYETSLNGYYSNFTDNSDVYLTRVIISFGTTYGHGVDTAHITYVSENTKRISTKIESEHPGTPGNRSYIILEGSEINIEIYEQSRKVERAFTSITIQELNDELKMVLNNLDEINKTGLSPIKTYYSNSADSSYFEINNGMQPGIYVIRAGFPNNEEGKVFVKVYNCETKARLSESSITPNTTRELGWSESEGSIFPYESEVIIYEGDWSHSYMARFEIWFITKQGDEIKLAEKERLIYGWQH